MNTPESTTEKTANGSRLGEVVDFEKQMFNLKLKIK
jgi:hypothetical protein